VVDLLVVVIEASIGDCKLLSDHNRLFVCGLGSTCKLRRDEEIDAVVDALQTPNGYNVSICSSISRYHHVKMCSLCGR
jgi:hypothetical protein